MDAVGADHVGRHGGAAVLERRLGVPWMGGDRDAALVQRDGVGLSRAHRAGEKAVQIGAMQHEMRRAEALDALVAEIEPVPGLARAPVPQLAPLGADLHPGERRFQAEREQHTRAVRADLDAGADLPELARLLVDLDIDAAREQSERRGQSTDAGSDHNDFLWRAHGLFRVAPRHAILPTLHTVSQQTSYEEDRLHRSPAREPQPG